MVQSSADACVLMNGKPDRAFPAWVRLALAVAVAASIFCVIYF
jgi:hypothetical protein